MVKHLLWQWDRTIVFASVLVYRDQAIEHSESNAISFSNRASKLSYDEYSSCDCLLSLINFYAAPYVLSCIHTSYFLDVPYFFKPFCSLTRFASKRQSENPLHRVQRPIESIARNICPNVIPVTAEMRWYGDLRCLTTHSQSRKRTAISGGRLCK